MEFLNEQGRGILDEAVDANEQHQPGDAADLSDGNVVNQGDGNGAREGDDGVVIAVESNVEGSETGEGEGDAVSDDGSMSIYSLWSFLGREEIAASGVKRRLVGVYSRVPRRGRNVFCGTSQEFRGSPSVLTVWLEEEPYFRFVEADGEGDWFNAWL